MGGQERSFLADEIRYWGEQYRRWAPETARHYEWDAFRGNVWGLYGYAPYLTRLAADARVVEFGSGNVAKALYLSLFSGFRNVCVTDITPAALEACRETERALRGHITTTYAVMDGESLALRPDSCDAIFCHSSLHHVTHADRAIASAARALKPGGLLILGHEPNLATFGMLRRIGQALRLTEKHTSETYSVADAEVLGFARSDLTRWCREAGLEVRAVQPVWYVQGVLFFFQNLTPRLVGRQLRVPTPIRTLSGLVDRAIVRLPGMANVPLFWTVVAAKPASQAAASR